MNKLIIFFWNSLANGCNFISQWVSLQIDLSQNLEKRDLIQIENLLVDSVDGQGELVFVGVDFKTIMFIIILESPMETNDYMLDSSMMRRPWSRA